MGGIACTDLFSTMMHLATSIESTTISAIGSISSLVFFLSCSLRALRIFAVGEWVKPTRCSPMVAACLACFVALVAFCSRLLRCMKLLDVPLGLLFNFPEIRLIDGLSRLILPGANPPGTKGNKGNEEGAGRSGGLRRGEARKH